MKLPTFLVFPLLLSLWACQNGVEKPEENTGVRQTAAVQQGGEAGIFLQVDDQEITAGAELCVDVKAKAFTEVVSMQYTMNWDPTALAYQRVQNFQLKYIGPTNFGATRSKEGKLVTSWFDQDIKGISVPENTSLYQVCFQAVGASGSSSKLFFNGDPVVIEISNKEGALIGFASRRATISIK